MSEQNNTKQDSYYVAKIEEIFAEMGDVSLQRRVAAWVYARYSFTPMYPVYQPYSNQQEPYNPFKVNDYDFTITCGDSNSLPLSRLSNYFKARNFPQGSNQ